MQHKKFYKKTENLMQREKRKRVKIDNLRVEIDNLRVPQPNQEMCAPNTRATNLSRGHIVKRGMNEKKI